MCIYVGGDRRWAEVGVVRECPLTPVLALRTDLHLRLPSGLYSIIVRYLLILFPEPSTACPRVGTVYIQLLNTCYGFPQIISLWIPLTAPEAWHTSGLKVALTTLRF